MRIFLSGSFKLCGDIFDHLEDTFKYVGEVVRMDRFWASQTLYDTTNWSKDKFWEIDCRCLSNCDVVIFCGDWMKHEGCRREYERAKTEGKTILYAENASPAPLCKDTTKIYPVYQVKMEGDVGNVPLYNYTNFCSSCLATLMPEQISGGYKYCPHCGVMIKWPRKYMVVPQDELARNSLADAKKFGSLRDGMRDC